MEIQTRQLVAANVKRLRQARHMTQTQLGERSGVGQTTVSSVEQPGGKSPTLETLAALAKALDVPEWTLLVDGAALDATQLKAMDALVHSYAALPASGKTQVLRVAEAEERYAKAG
jgi:transcriptional regulator with XRE-family HTH domain